MPSDKDRLRQVFDHIDRLKAAKHPAIVGSDKGYQIVERPWAEVPERSKLAMLQDLDWSNVTVRDRAHILLGQVDPGKISDVQRNRLIDEATRGTPAIEDDDRPMTPGEWKAWRDDVMAEDRAVRVMKYGEAETAKMEQEARQRAALEQPSPPPNVPPITEAELQEVERGWSLGKGDLRAGTEPDRPIHQVWHANNLFAASHLGSLFGIREPEFPTEYQLVAHVHAGDLEQVFALTNHGDQDWAKNDGVQSVADDARSTSVGDVIVDPEGRPHRVEPMGFEEIRWPPKTPTERVERHIEEMKAQSEILLESTRHYVMPDPEDAASIYDTCDSLGPWESLNPTEKLSALYELDWQGVSIDDQRRIIGREVDLSHVSREDQDRYFKDALQVHTPEAGRNTANPREAFADILRNAHSTPPDTRSDFQRLLDEAGERVKPQPRDQGRDRGGPER